MNFYFTGRVDPSTRGCQKNGPSAPGPGVELAEPSSVHRLFEAQAARAPDGIALVFKNRHVSYGELNRRSAALGRVLGSCLAQSNGLVGICAERSPELAVALLAVLRAGAAYVPLDPSGPDERLRAMLDDARPDMVLTQRHLLSRVSGWARAAICLEDESRFDASDGGGALGAAAGGAQLAYVIYTSGSTGRPKGVLIEHRALANHSIAAARLFDLRAGDRVLQFASLAFDVAAEEIFPTWLSGATVVMWPVASGVAPIRKFVEFVDEAQITVLNLPAPYWHEWAAELEQVGVPGSVRLVVVGSDTVRADRASLWQRFTAGRVRLINAYGPSETTITATVYEMPSSARETDGSVPIGRPIANVQAYVLDDDHHAVPSGSAGELYIGGAGVARGYLNLPAETAEKFIADPFRADCGARLYKTGDLVRRLADGNLEFLGRLDDQIKIRGFRVEIADIETALGRHPKVHSVAVVGREDEPGTRSLVAYIVPRNGPPPAPRQLRRFLQSRLPDYMVPQVFVTLRQLPFTANGKVDRRRLPAPRPSRAELETEFVPPRSDIEAALAQIWESALGISPVGVRDDFFELAGHSLLLVRVAAQIEQRLGVNLALTSLFQARTIETLARLVASKQSDRARALIFPYRIYGERPPLFCHGGSDDLARCLGAEQPLYWLDPHGMNGGCIPDTIEEMAATYLAEIRRIQPRGPYCLLGYSFGGLVILELARLIIEAGEKIGLLVLVDPSPPPELKAATRSATGRLGVEATAPPGSRRGGAMRKLLAMWRNVPRRVRWWQRMAKVLLCETCVALGRPVPPSLRLSHFAAGSDRALARYKTKTYPGSFVLFRRPDNLTEAHWRGLASGEVVMHETWMDHNEFLEQPYVQTICREIIHQMGLAQAATAPRAGSHPRSQQVVAGSDGEPRFAE